MILSMSPCLLNKFVDIPFAGLKFKASNE
uniref:Uncharacterized protein n=1 Tax=Rhizophora mucronata TaxID=61149 RepID=A0A2P2P9V6_RHIMU